MKTQIKPFENHHQPYIIDVWEKSVKATHHFLSDEHFHKLKTMLMNFDFNSISTYCCTIDNKVVGFIGFDHNKIEMLFLDPKYFGQRLGYQLVQFAIDHGKVNEVDVNEHNKNAVIFYEKIGFRTVHRSETDAMDLPYPILTMQLQGE